MDEVKLTKQQAKALADVGETVVITAVIGDSQLVHYEREKYRGNRGEGKWLQSNGKPRAE